MSFRSQWRTLVAPVAHPLRGHRAPSGHAWTTKVVDGERIVKLSGHLSGPANASAVVIVVHGLGGHADAHYAKRAAAAADAQGFAALRLSLRGADRSGEDIYHAGLTADIHAAIASSALRRFARIYVLGYSLGGHTTLLAATEAADPRVLAVAAIQPPLDLAAGQQHLDRNTRFYRHYILRALKAIHAAAERRGRVAPVPGAARIRTIREWDERVVATRFGFAGAADYYARASVGPRLGALRIPAIAVESRHDPLVPPVTLERWLEPLPPRLEVRWLSHAGHGASTGREDLGLDGPRGLEPQLMAWFTSVTEPGAARARP